MRSRDAVHFRKIIAARKQLAEAEQEFRDAVQAARDAGDSWTVIGTALDTTQQVALLRFGKTAKNSESQGSPGSTVQLPAPGSGFTLLDCNL